MYFIIVTAWCIISTSITISNFSIDDWRKCYMPEGGGYESPWLLNIIQCAWSFQPQHDPEVCSGSNINEYQKIFREMILGSKTRPASNLTANYKSIV
jgi:hypothetical protein